MNPGSGAGSAANAAVCSMGVVILAAGLSRRMGCPKMLLPLAGQPLLAHVLATVANGKVPWADCLAVIGDPRQELADLCIQYGIRPVYNPRAVEGQASSIVLALQHLRPKVDGILFVLGDQPFLPGTLLEALVQQFTLLHNKKAIVVPQHRGRRCSPVLFGACWRRQLASLTGDCGGRVLIRRHPACVTALEWEDESAFSDIDTWEEYQLLCQRLRPV